MILRFAPCLVALVALAPGCGEPRHLGYDFGRTYTEAFTAQGDLTRPSVQQAQHPLEGNIATKIRLNVEEATTEKQDAKVTLSTGQ